MLYIDRCCACTGERIETGWSIPPDSVNTFPYPIQLVAHDSDWMHQCRVILQKNCNNVFSQTVYTSTCCLCGRYISQSRVPSFNSHTDCQSLVESLWIEKYFNRFKTVLQSCLMKIYDGMYIGLYMECNIMWTTTRHVYNMREMTSQRIRLQSTIPVNKTWLWWLELSEPLGGPKADPFKILFYSILLRGTTHMAMPQSRFTVMTRGIKRNRHRLPNGIESISIDAYGSTPHVEPMYRRP